MEYLILALVVLSLTVLGWTAALVGRACVLLQELRDHFLGDDDESDNPPT